MRYPSAQIFDRGLDVFGEVVANVEPGAWERPSPCEGWRAIDVLGHLGSSMGMALSVMRGEQPSWPQAERPGDLVDDEPVAYWQDLAARLRAALDGADLDVEMDTPIGRRTAADRLAFPAIDLFVHAWDIGQATGQVIEIPDDVIAFSRGYIDPLPVEMVRGPNAAFGPEVTPPEGATATEAFVAWTGRRPMTDRGDSPASR